MAHRLIPSLPRIKVDIGHIPQRLKLKYVSNPLARIEVLRRMVCRIVREERCEFQYNKAVECRQYLERLIQLGVNRGVNDAYTMEMMEWWLLEHDLMDKMFDTLVPRFVDVEEPYTSLYRLPKIRVQTGGGKRFNFFKHVEVGVLELNGNPFPSMLPLETQRQNALKEYVKKEINENRFR